jgi:hypothetical protein
MVLKVSIPPLPPLWAKFSKQAKDLEDAVYDFFFALIPSTLHAGCIELVSKFSFSNPKYFHALYDIPIRYAQEFIID